MRPSYHLEAEPYVSTYEELDIPVSERKSLLDLVEASCRWPIGDPQTAEFHFCNRSKVAGLPYCEFHARRAFQPVQPRRRDRVSEPMPMVTHIHQPSAATPPAPSAPAATPAKEPVEA
jgi:GcrA cell cycle regulator